MFAERGRNREINVSIIAMSAEVFWGIGKSNSSHDVHVEHHGSNQLGDPNIYIYKIIYIYHHHQYLSSPNVHNMSSASDV